MHSFATQRQLQYCLPAGFHLSLVLLLLLMVAFGGVGCVSQKPLPYVYSAPAPVASGAPELAVLPTKSARTNTDEMDKLLVMPGCLDEVLVKEMQNSGFFQEVCLLTNGTARSGYMVQGNLKELKWEVPGYDQMVSTAFIVSFLTGGIGGTIYGFTGVDVCGSASFQLVLSDVQENRVLLDRAYTADVKIRKIKFACDSAGTRRLVAAMAAQKAFAQFKEDVARLRLKQSESSGH